MTAEMLPLSVDAERPARGTLTYHPAVGPRRAMWHIAASPDVMIRVKRIFPRVRSTNTGTVTVMDSQRSPVTSNGSSTGTP